MKTKSIKNTLTIMCILLVLLVSIMLGVTSVISIKNTTDMALKKYEDVMNSGYDTEIKSEVQTVIAVLQVEYDKYQAGGMNEKEQWKNYAME